MKDEAELKKLVGGISAALEIACGSVERLKENGCLHNCASAHILEEHLKLASGLTDTLLGNTTPIAEVRARLSREEL